METGRGMEALASSLMAAPGMSAWARLRTPSRTKIDNDPGAEIGGTN